MKLSFEVDVREINSETVELKAEFLMKDLRRFPENKGYFFEAFTREIPVSKLRDLTELMSFAHEIMSKILPAADLDPGTLSTLIAPVIIDSACERLGELPHEFLTDVIHLLINPHVCAKESN